MEPLISVIVPVYNVEKYLPRCLDSIRAQTYTNLEIILVDDGSQDASGDICDDCAAKDDRVRVLHQSNAGIGSTRNAGLGMCTGAYITFVDSDDYLYPCAIETLYDRIREDDSDLVIGNCIRVYEDNTCSDTCYAFEDSVFAADEIFSRMAVFGAVPTAPWGKLYRKDILEGITYPSVHIGEDTLVFPSIVERCRRISLDNRPIYGYFQRHNSLMNEKSKQAKQGDIHAILHTARYLWDRGHHDGAAAWYGTAAKNALTIPGRRARLSDFHGFFDRKARKALRKKLDRKSKIAWICLHIPLIHIVFRQILH